MKSTRKLPMNSLLPAGSARRLIFLALISVAGLAQAHSLSGRQELLLNGANWTVVSCEPGEGLKQRAFDEGYPAARALAATVPGDIYWDLERAGKIPPIYEGTNSQKIGWVAAKEWWYRKRFTIPRGWRGRRVWLCFDALDYLGEVWLNGQYLGRHEGQFTSFEFEVTDCARLDGENLLTVRIAPGPLEVLKALAGESGQTIQDAMTRDLAFWKSRTASGWDWGTPLWTMGIWQDVRLIATRGVELKAIAVLPQLHPPYDTAELPIHFDIESKQDRDLQIIARARCLTAKAPVAEKKQTVTINAGTNRIMCDMPIARPQLWWPNGYGGQPLYELTITAIDPRTGDQLDRSAVMFGIRDLQMLANPPAEDNTQYMDFWTPKKDNVWMPEGWSTGVKPIDQSQQQRWLISINGRRIFARGGSWVPADLIYGRPGPAQYEHLIRMAALGQCNAFRYHGVGLIDKPVFYELCDRYGIMLLQEMPHAGRRPLETPQALANEGAQQRQVMRRLMNHPSIVRYGFGNELYIDSTNSSQVAQFKDVCKELDPTRPAVGPDPVTVAQRHGPHWFFIPGEYGVYKTGYPLTDGPGNPNEWSEYGASGASSVETLKRIIPADHLWPIRNGDPFWRWHKALDAYVLNTWLLPENYRHLFGELPDLETEVRASQFVQAEGLRYADQSQRRHEWHRSGCYAWSYNEPWPNAAQGCVVEYYGRPKMAYYYQRDAYAPIDVSAEYDTLAVSAGGPLPATIYVCSDRTTPLDNCKLTAVLMDLEGHGLGASERRLTVQPECASKIGSTELMAPMSAAGKVVLLQVRLRDSNDAVLSCETYVFAVNTPSSATPPPPSAEMPAEALRPLLSAPATQLAITVGKGENQTLHGSPMRVHRVTVTNRGKTPALFVDVSGACPPQECYVEENDFTLLPGESVQTRVLVPSEATAAGAETISAKGWNTAAIAAPLRQ
jgi:beta-mannosidase